MPRISVKRLHMFAIASAFCVTSSLVFACPDGELMHLFPGVPVKTTRYCISGHCLKSNQIHYEDGLPMFPKDELPLAVAKVPAVLAFLESLSKHKTVAEWCAALKATAELRRPLFCNKPEVIVGVLPQEAPPLKKLVISWNESPGAYFFWLDASRRGSCGQYAAVNWDSTSGRMLVDSPADLINFFFKRNGCKLVQPPVATYEPASRPPELSASE